MQLKKSYEELKVGNQLQITATDQAFAKDVASWCNMTGASLVSVETWLPAGDTVAVGDTFKVTAGCDKYFDTCKSKFDNGDNFRGFPHLIGQEVAGYVNSDTDLSGGSRYGN